MLVFKIASGVGSLFIRLGSSRAESFPITMCPESVSCLLDLALEEPSLSLSLCVRRTLFIIPSDSSLDLYLSLCVRCPLFIYLRIYLVNFFLKFFHSLQFLTESFHIKHEFSR